MNNIGFVGLGAMGSVMSPLLSKAGFNVYGFDLKSIQDIKNVKIVKNLLDLYDKDIIIFMLPDGKIVQEAVGQLLKKNCKSLMIDMSSSDPNDTISLGAVLKKSGIEFIDAPVSGGVARARIGELIIMVGGNEYVIEKARDILEVMGNVKRAGPLGAGHAMKSLNNYVSAAGLISSLEALDAAKKYGIDPENFIEIINGATGKNNTTEVKLKKFVISQKYNSGFALDLMIKDVLIANSLIKKMTINDPLSINVLEYLKKSLKILNRNSDHTEVFKIFRK